MRSERLHPILAALPLTIWTLFHLWEQWAAFAGRDAWLARMRGTSQGALAIAIELAVAIVPLAAWAGLAIRDLVRRAPLPGATPTEGAGTIERALARLAPFAALAAIAFVAVHVGHLWAPKLAYGTLAERWWALTHDLGTPPMLALYAVGLAAVALQIAVALPAALAALGGLESPGARRQALIVSSVLGLAVWVLAVQLTGWLATGHGTFWPIEVIAAP